MEPKFNTSFIPKKSLQAEVGGASNNRYTSRRSIYGPGFFVSSVIFALAVLAALGVFGYTQVVEKQVDEKISTVQKSRAVLDPALIKQLARMDLRLRAANVLLNDHVALSQLLSAVEAITLQKIQYTSLAYSVTSRDPAPTLAIEGVATDMRLVAAQNEQFVLKDGFKDAVLSTLQRDKDDNGNLTFEIDMTVDPQLTSYVNAVKDGARSASVPVAPAVTTPPATPAGPVLDTGASTTSSSDTSL